MDSVKELRIVHRGESGMGELPRGVSMNRKLSTLEYVETSSHDQLPKYLIGPIEALKKYIKKQDPAIYPVLLNARLKIVDEHGNDNLLTPLGYALWQNDYPLMKLLLNSCADCDLKPCVPLGEDIAQAPDYDTPLHMSVATFCDPKIVQALLEWSGNNDTFTGSVAESVVCYVTQYDCVEHSLDDNLIRLLLERVPSIDIQCSHNGKGPLHMAVASNNVRCLKILLSFNPNIDALSRSRKTPLIMACEKNRAQLVDILLKHGANVNLSDAVGRTALHYAVRLSTQEVVESLLRADANIQVLEVRGLTPLDYIFAKRDEKGAKLMRKDPRESRGALLEAFLVHSAENVKIEESNFDDAAYEMMEGAESEDAVQKLLTNNKEIFQERMRRRSTVESLVHLAAKFHKPQTLEWLINHKMRIFDQDPDGFLPIHCAFSSGALPCAELLLHNGADVNSKTTQGWTPMWLAVRFGHVDMASQFVEYGANISASIKIRVLQQAQTHLKLPITLFDPEKQREDPRAFAIFANHNISMAEYTIHANFYRITRTLLQAGAPLISGAKSGLVKQPNDVKKFQELITLKLKEEEVLPKNADGRAQRIRSLSKLGHLVNKEPTLKEMVRYVIRTQLGSNVPGKVQGLHLPRDLTDYLCLTKTFDSMRGVTFARIPSD